MKEEEEERYSERRQNRKVVRRRNRIESYVRMEVRVSMSNDKIKSMIGSMGKKRNILPKAG